MIHQEARVGSNTRFWFPELSNIGKCVIGNDCIIHTQVAIHDGVVIGNNVKIEGQVFIPDGVEIEDDVFVGPQVCFTNDPQLSIKGKEGWAKTLVKKGVKIGAGARIKAGVVIGEGAIIGMGAVVLCNVPAGETWVGVPARKIK